MDEMKMNRTFVRIVECGSLSAAARSLDTPVASVARQLSCLESHLGVRLLNRTTRRQALTQPGKFYLDELVEILRRFDAAKQDASSYQSTVSGVLRVHLRTSIGNQFVVPALPSFLSRYPQLKLELTLTDRRVDLLSHSVDVAVWLGDLEDSSLIARRLNTGSRILCASQDYLDRMGVPRTPMDLVNHNCLVFDAPHYRSPWRFNGRGDSWDVHISGNIRSNNSAALVSAVTNGIGIAILQAYLVRKPISNGALVQLLPEYDIAPSEGGSALHVVYPSRSGLSLKARVFVDFLIGLFQSEDIQR